MADMNEIDKCPLFLQRQCQITIYIFIQDHFIADEHWIKLYMSTKMKTEYPKVHANKIWIVGIASWSLPCRIKHISKVSVKINKLKKGNESFLGSWASTAMIEDQQDTKLHATVHIKTKTQTIHAWFDMCIVEVSKMIEWIRKTKWSRIFFAISYLVQGNSKTNFK